jgi:hypothetical protein
MNMKSVRPVALCVGAVYTQRLYVVGIYVAELQNAEAFKEGHALTITGCACAATIDLHWLKTLSNCCECNAGCRTS